MTENEIVENNGEQVNDENVCKEEEITESASADECETVEEEPSVEIKVVDVDYAEFRRLLVSYYDGLTKIIRIDKNKDSTIAILTKEVQAYREGFFAKLVKPICLSVINLREDYKKTQRDIDSYAQSVQSVLKYCDYILSDIEDLLSEQNVVLKDGQFYIDNIPVVDKIPRKACVEAQNPECEESTVESATAPDETEQSFDGILELIKSKNDELLALLNDNRLANSNLATYAKVTSSIDDNYSDAILLPIFKSLVAVYEAVKSAIDKATQAITDENKTEKYNDVLSVTIDGLNDVLALCGVSIREDVSDSYDMKSSRILKVIKTDDAALEQKVAKRYSDCYVLEDKIIYPFKVDVYKYNK